ncbi:MAG: cobyrinic acid a,c-diamide synthase [Desulfuromonas sp.]|uniref:phosphotransacetylase family protein n=1 Tax=Desulfuromonas sp. TaxID=892 RepID=UPI000CC92E5A|nr:AAA family ATPase [Desulfuromonas sp.]PLX83288.1 MAG: cobyrinic acid a,c-diamide synthase [Desulfuromonas sp.]
MAKKIFVAATGQNTGKTTTSLSLLHLARKKYGRIGFIKPIGPKVIELYGLRVDKDPALMSQVYGLEEKLALMSPVVLGSGTTKKVLRGEINPQELEDKVLSAVAALERECDLLVIEGAGHSGVGSVIGLSNARIARLVDAPVMLITGGGIGNVVDAVAMNLALYRQEGAEIRLIVSNKIIPEKREETLRYLKLAFEPMGLTLLGGFNYQPILANPTLRRISKILELPIQGSAVEDMRIVNHVQIGAPSTQRVVDLLQESTLLLVTSSRDELLVTLANLYTMPEYKSKIAGLIIPGVAPVSRITQQILDRSAIPYMRTTRTTADLFLTINDDVSKLSAEDTQKIALIQELAEKRFDFEEVDRLFS